MPKKKKRGRQQQPLPGPKKYIVTRARALPVYKCFINKNWQSSRMANIAVLRKHVNHHITAAFYVVDMLSYGLTDSHFMFNTPEPEVMELLEAQYSIADPYEETDYSTVHNIIYGAVDFFGDYEIAPHKSFSVTRYLLEEDTGEAGAEDIPFGIKHKPAFIHEAERREEARHAELYAYTEADWQALLTDGARLKTKNMALVTGAWFQHWLSQQPPEENHYIEPRLDEKSYLVSYAQYRDSYARDEDEQKTVTRLAELLDQLEKNGDDIVAIETQAKEAVERYPHNPVLHDFVALCAFKKGDEAEHRKQAEAIARQFPGFVYGLAKWLTMLLNEDQPDEVAKFLNHTWYLHDLLPGQKVFHILDLEAFNATMARYFIMKGNLLQAQRYLDWIAELREQDDYERTPSPFLMVAETEFLLIRIKKLQAYMDELISHAHATPDLADRD